MRISPAVRIVQAADKADQRRFPGAAPPHHADHLARLDRETDVAEAPAGSSRSRTTRPAIRLGLEPGRAPRRGFGQPPSLGRIEQVADAAADAEEVGEPSGRFGNRSQRGIEHRQVLQERHQCAERHLAERARRGRRGTRRPACRGRKGTPSPWRTSKLRYRPKSASRAGGGSTRRSGGSRDPPARRTSRRGSPRACPSGPRPAFPPPPNNGGGGAASNA